jgi:hypothetical protein
VVVEGSRLSAGDGPIANMLKRIFRDGASPVNNSC